MKKILIAIFLIFSFIPVLSYAACPSGTCEVLPTAAGNEDCDGVANACVLATAEGLAVAGDTIHLGDGTYTDIGEITFDVANASEVLITADQQGDVTFAGDVRFKVWGGDNYTFRYIDFVAADDAGADNDNIIVAGNNGSNLTVTYCRFYSCGNAGSEGLVQFGEWDTGEVSYCLFDDALTGYMIRGVLREDLSRNRPENITISNNTFQNSGGAYSAISIGAGGTQNDGTEPVYWTIEYNTFDELSSESGNAREIIAVKTSNNVIRYNNFTDDLVFDAGQESYGISFNRGNDNEAYGNTFNGMPGAIRLLGLRHQVYDNLIIGSSKGIRFTRGCIDESAQSGCEPSDPCYCEVALKDSTIANNTIVLTTGYQAMYVWGNSHAAYVPENNTYINNIVVSDHDYFFYDSNNYGAGCVGADDPNPWCTGAGTGTFYITFNINNSSCLAASDPWPCCTGSGTGTCEPNTIDYNLFDALDDVAVDAPTGTNATEADADLDANYVPNPGSISCQVGGYYNGYTTKVIWKDTDLTDGMDVVEDSRSVGLHACPGGAAGM